MTYVPFYKRLYTCCRFALGTALTLVALMSTFMFKRTRTVSASFLEAATWSAIMPDPWTVEHMRRREDANGARQNFAVERGKSLPVAAPIKIDNRHINLSTGTQPSALEVP